MADVGDIVAWRRIRGWERWLVSEKNGTVLTIGPTTSRPLRPDSSVFYGRGDIHIGAGTSLPYDYLVDESEVTVVG